MKRFIIAAAAYGAIGLAGGLYYRTLTHQVGFEGGSQLGLVHTHFLMLGMFAFLIFAALEGVLGFVGSRSARWFEVLWHVGLIVTGGMMAVKGTLQVLNVSFFSAALAGISGTGHMVLTAAVVLLFVALLKAVKDRRPIGTGTLTTAEPVKVGA